MFNRYRALLLVGAAIACLAVAARAQPKPEKSAHSGFHRDFDPGDMVVFCQGRFGFVTDKCGTGSRGLGIKWKGEESTEDFKIFHLTGDLSEDEVKQVLGALQPELVKRAKAGKAALEHDPKDTIVDRPMRLLQPGLIWGGTAVVPAGVRGFYFPYKDGKVEGWVDVLAAPLVRDKKTEWLIIGSVHEVAR